VEKISYIKASENHKITNKNHKVEKISYIKASENHKITNKNHKVEKNILYKGKWKVNPWKFTDNISVI
jgi:hypothetical protein